MWRLGGTLQKEELERKTILFLGLRVYFKGKQTLDFFLMFLGISPKQNACNLGYCHNTGPFSLIKNFIQKNHFKLKAITDSMCQLQINQHIKQLQKDNSLKGKPKGNLQTSHALVL